MEDYLALIKNPRKSSVNAQQPTNSNNSRSQSPLLNPATGLSSNLPYINNLDKIKAVDLKAWGNKDLQDTSPSRPYKPPENKFIAPVDPLPNRNTMFAPQNKPADPLASNSSLFGADPPRTTGILGRQESPDLHMKDRSPRGSYIRPNQDPSPRNNLFGSNSSNQSSALKRSGEPEEGSFSSRPSLYGQGSTNALSNPVRRNNGSLQVSAGSGTAGFKNGNRFSQRDSSPTFGKRSDKVDKPKASLPKRPSSKKGFELPMIVLGGLLVILVLVAVKVMTSDPVKFCDTDELYPKEKGCNPCPLYGRCSHGRLIDCEDKYKPYKGECVLDAEQEAEFSQYRKYINSRLAFNKGEALCYGNEKNKDFFTIGEIQVELQNRFGKNDVLTSPRFPILWKKYFEEDEGLFVNGMTDYYMTKDEGNPSLTCKFTLLWREGKLFGLWFIFFISTVMLAIKLLRRHLIYSRLGKEMYQDVEEYLCHFKNVSVKTLKKEFEHKYPGKNFEKIWSYVEDYRKQDAKIYQYFDTYQGVIQPFWLRVR